MRVDQIEVRDLRNIRAATLELAPRINVLIGRNAQRTPGRAQQLRDIGRTIEVSGGEVIPA